MARRPDGGPSLSEARRRLAARHIPTAVARGIGWARIAALDPADLVGAAMLGLCRAAGRYRIDGRRPAPSFLWWARLWMDGECRREIRAWHRYRGRHGPLARPDLVADQDEDGGGGHPALAEAWAALPAREREVLERRIAGGQTYAEAGAAVGLSPRGCQYAEARALARLRAALAPQPAAP